MLSETQWFDFISILKRIAEALENLQKTLLAIETAIECLEE